MGCGGWRSWFLLFLRSALLWIRPIKRPDKRGNAHQAGREYEMIITEMPYTRTMVPTGKHNTRKATCRRCLRDVRGGEGVQYDSTMGSYLIISSRIYMCPKCAEIEEQIQAMRPEVMRTLDIIEDWCIENVQTRLGSITADRIRAMVYSAELAGLDVAEAINAAIRNAPDTSFDSVMDAARAAALEVVGCQK